MSGTILAIDDDETFRNLLTFVLVNDGFEVITGGSGAEMHARLNEQSIDLLILDLGLPDRDGITLLREFRSRSSMPVIVLTGSKGKDVAISALEAGADDYITKPFDPKEVLSRIKNILKRRERGSEAGAKFAGSRINFAGLVFEPEARSVRCAGEMEIRLTPIESSLLGTLLAQPRKLLLREQLAEAISAAGGAVSPRMVDVFISQLRAKMEPLNKGRKLIQAMESGYLYAGEIEA